MAIIGIDLGTTNSLVSVWKDGEVRLIPNAFGEYLTPSIVSFGDNGEVYVGKIAKEMLITRPARTFSEFKRFMGTDKMFLTYRPEELSSFVLRRLKEDAERFLGEPVTEAVISVPAYFDDNRRCATRQAGFLAGLQVKQMVNEPSAVALKHHIATEEMEKFIIVDLGGGTLDVSLVDAFDNIVEILTVSGDNHLGGKDFNEIIANDFYTKNGIDPNKLSGEEKGIVIKQAELLKIDLTESNSAARTFHLNDRQYTMTMANQELIHLSADLLKRIAKPIKKVILDGNVMWSEIDKVILVGGSSKMPIVKKYIASICGTEVVVDTDPDESIAMGAGIAAAIQMRAGEIRDMLLTDVCPFSMGIRIKDNIFSPIIERNTKLPCSRTKRYYTMSDNQSTISIDIYQGESMLTADNLNLGKLEVLDLPRGIAGSVFADVTFMYDIDGILDVTVVCGDKIVHQAILSKGVRMSQKELEVHIAKLKAMTIHPSEKEENRLLLEKALRIYKECSQGLRDQVARYYNYFQDILYHGNDRQIREAYVQTSMFLEMAERYISGEDDEEELDESFWTEDEE